jgi:hypothetical protein
MDGKEYMVPLTLAYSAGLKQNGGHPNEAANHLQNISGEFLQGGLYEWDYIKYCNFHNPSAQEYNRT